MTGVIVATLTMVDVDVEPVASQLQKLLTRLVAILRTLARREVQSTVVVPRLYTTVALYVVLAGRIDVRVKFEVNTSTLVVVVEMSRRAESESKRCHSRRTENAHHFL